MWATYLFTLCMQYPKMPEEGIRSSGTGVKEVCGFPVYGKNGPHVFLTTEPSSQPRAGLNFVSMLVVL